MKNRAFRIVWLAIFTALIFTGSGLAETKKSSDRGANKVAYIRTANVGLGLSAEAVNLVDLVDFSSSDRTFAACIHNESTTPGEDLLVEYIPSGSVVASQRTTPDDGVLTKTVRITAGSEPVCIESVGTGWIWQSEGPVTVDANAIITY